MLLTAAQGLVSSATAGVNLTHQLQGQANSTLLEFKGLEMVAENVSTSVENAKDLPSQANNLTIQARQIVSELQEKLTSTTPPDTDFLDSIQAYITMLADQLSTSNLEAVTAMLEHNLTSIQSTLSGLQEEYQQIEQEVEELRELADMLPPDCDSDY